jgi:cellulase/cellobiase CelA1
VDRRNRERALRANTWPALSSSSSSSSASRSRRPLPTTNGDDVVVSRVMNGDHIARPQYRQRQTPRVSSKGLARSSLRHVQFVEEEGEEHDLFTNGDGIERDGIVMKGRDV